MNPGFQILFAIVNTLIFSFVFTFCLRTRASSMGEVIKLYLMSPTNQAANVPTGNVSTSRTRDLRSAISSILQNVALVAALFLTVQYSIMITLTDTESLLSMCVSAALWNSILSSSIAFIISVHYVLAISIFDDRSVEAMVSHIFKYGTFSISGSEIIGLVIVASNLTLYWLGLWGFLWILDNQNNKLGMALYWCMGFTFLAFVIEFSFFYFFQIVNIRAVI